MTKIGQNDTGNLALYKFEKGYKPETELLVNKDYKMPTDKYQENSDEIISYNRAIELRQKAILLAHSLQRADDKKLDMKEGPGDVEIDKTKSDLEILHRGMPCKDYVDTVGLMCRCMPSAFFASGLIGKTIRESLNTLKEIITAKAKFSTKMPYIDTDPNFGKKSPENILKVDLTPLNYMNVKTQNEESLSFRREGNQEIIEIDSNRDGRRVHEKVVYEQGAITYFPQS
jgi:hypothetical protein